MPNVLLTQNCVRSCPYCFASQKMKVDIKKSIISWEDFIYLCDLAEASGDQRLSLLGGEPTLHPHFIDFLLYMTERNIHATVFTSGIMSEPRLKDLAKSIAGLTKKRINFVCNLNSPAESPDWESKRIIPFLEAFGGLVTPGFNIYRPDFDLKFLFDYINRFGLHRHIRLGLAHPVNGGLNQHVTLDKLPETMDHLISYLPYFMKFRVTPGFDCGFPLCTFNDEKLGALYRLTGGRMKFGCGPAIDIGPDMTVWSCFPLSGYYAKSVYEFDHLREIHDFYQEKLKVIRIEAGGIYDACDHCSYREDDLCGGGCISHTLSHFRHEEPVRHPEINEWAATS